MKFNKLDAFSIPDCHTYASKRKRVILVPEVGVFVMLIQIIANTCKSLSFLK